MPVKQFKQQVSSEHAVLASELAAEWAASESSKTEPVILEETDDNGAVAHVYVVWSKWADLDMTERSEIIMDAAHTKFQPAEVLEISLAMGLTPKEADRLRIDWRG